MSSFPLTAGAHYFDSLKMFEMKSGQIMKHTEILQKHIPTLIQRILPRHDGKQFNILSVGSGHGEKDLLIVKISKEELQESDKGRFMKIFNRAIEPNEYSCGLYKAAIENLPAPLDGPRKPQRVNQIWHCSFHTQHLLFWHGTDFETLFRKRTQRQRAFCLSRNGLWPHILGIVEAKEAMAWRRHGKRKLRNSWEASPDCQRKRLEAWSLYPGIFYRCYRSVWSEICSSIS